MNKVGKFGEDVACMFLKKHGYRVVERNYLRKWGELDIVAKKAKKLCFVEVKTVSCEMPDKVSKNVSCETGKAGDGDRIVVTHGTSQTKSKSAEYRPEDNMHPAKMKKFTRIIQTYLQEKKLDQADWLAALIAIRVDTTKKIAKVRFIENLILE